MAPNTKEYTMAEVGAHNTKDDLWVVIHDKVYDVTKFQLEHPGGDEVLLDVAGKNGTREFDDADHSSSAIEQMAKYYVGDIVEAERREAKTTKKPADAKSKEQSQSNYVLVVISAAVVAFGAFVLYRGYKMSTSR